MTLLFSSQKTLSCVTITNVLASQYVVHCDTVLQPVITDTYVNLAYADSLAKEAVATTTNSAKGVSSHSSKITHTTKSTHATKSTYTTKIMHTTKSMYTSATKEAAAATSSSSSKQMLSAGAIAGISIAGVALVAALVGAAILLFIRRRKAAPERFEESRDIKPSPQLPLAPPGTFVTTNANDSSTYLSPIERARAARINEACDAARVHELDGSIVTTPSTSSMPSPSNPKSWWRPPKTRPTKETNPSTRWSVRNAPRGVQTYIPSRDVTSTHQIDCISENPKTDIRAVPQSAEIGLPLTSSAKLTVSDGLKSSQNEFNRGPVAVKPLTNNWYLRGRKSVGNIPDSTAGIPVTPWPKTVYQPKGYPDDCENQRKGVPN